MSFLLQASVPRERSKLEGGRACLMCVCAVDGVDEGAMGVWCGDLVMGRCSGGINVECGGARV
jgi:hypothetical protein